MDLATHEKFKATITGEAKELAEKNSRIYMDYVPTDISSIPKIEKKIMVSSKPLPVNYLNKKHQKSKKYLKNKKI